MSRQKTQGEREIAEPLIMHGEIAWQAWNQQAHTVSLKSLIIIYLISGGGGGGAVWHHTAEIIVLLKRQMTKLRI